MNQPTEDRIKKIEERQEDFNRRLSDMERQRTEEIKVTRVEVASADVLNQLKTLEQKQDEHFNQLKEGLESLSRRQSEYDKGLLSHSRSISTLQNQMNEVSARLEKIESTMATKQELTTLKTAQDAHFDQIEAEQKQQHDMLRQILRLLGQKD